MTKVKRQRKLPYTLIDNYLFDTLEVSPNAKILLFYLLRYTNGDGMAFPGLRLLSKQMCISRPTVVRMIKFWEWTGFLEVQRSISSNGDNDVNVYIVNDVDLEDFLKDLLVHNALNKKNIAFNDFFDYYIKNDSKERKDNLKDFDFIVEYFLKEK